MSDAGTDDAGRNDAGPPASGEGADLGAADPITGTAAGDGDLDAEAVLPDDPGTDYAADDPLALKAESMDTVTNDAVAGQTVLPGRGDGNDGPTGGAPGEIQPILPDPDRDEADFDLRIED